MTDPSHNRATQGIGDAIAAMERGELVARAGWDGMWLAIWRPDGRLPSKSSGRMSEPFVYMRTAQGGFVPWLCSQADLLARDWTVVADCTE